VNAVPPTVSVVVTTYQRGAAIAATLREVLQNAAPAEVIVVDDGSTDTTGEVLEALAREHPRLRHLRQPNAGQQAAMMAGARAAAGEVVLLLDDDIVPALGVAQGHAAHHAAMTRLVVVGHMPVLETTPDRRSWARDIYARAYVRHCAGWEADPGSVLPTLWAGHLSLRRVDFLALADRLADGPRGYHNDLDLGLCAAEAGLVGRFDRSLAARHLFTRTPEAFAANALDSGRGHADVLLRHRDALGDRATPPPAPAALRVLVRRRRGVTAASRILRLAIDGLGALRLFMPQRVVARQLWNLLQAVGFARRISELQGAQSVRAAEARVAT
jgi:glycosyltransferase involved in cell wall biosynthesis